MLRSLVRGVTSAGLAKKALAAPAFRRVAITGRPLRAFSSGNTITAPSNNVNSIQNVSTVNVKAYYVARGINIINVHRRVYGSSGAMFGGGGASSSSLSPWGPIAAAGGGADAFTSGAAAMQQSMVQTKSLTIAVSPTLTAAHAGPPS